MGRALAYFRKVLKESGSQWARALMRERELFCGALGIPLAPYVPPREGANPLKVAPEGIRQSIGIMRTLPNYERCCLRSMPRASIRRRRAVCVRPLPQPRYPPPPRGWAPASAVKGGDGCAECGKGETKSPRGSV